MMRRIRWGNVIRLILFIILIYMIIFRLDDIKNSFSGITEKTSKLAAKNYLESSPTYLFDGFDMEYASTGIMNCKNCWEYLFKFKTENSGYGDRSNQKLDSIINGHKATVFVDNGEIIYIIIDNKWDELNQEYVTNSFVSNS